MDREKYILGNKNVSIKEYFDLIVKVAGKGLSPLIRLPMRVGSHYSWWDCAKAREELDLGQRSIEESIEEAVRWFEKNGYI